MEPSAAGKVSLQGARSAPAITLANSAVLAVLVDRENSHEHPALQQTGAAAAVKPGDFLCLADTANSWAMHERAALKQAFVSGQCT